MPASLPPSVTRTTSAFFSTPWFAAIGSRPRARAFEMSVPPAQPVLVLHGLPLDQVLEEQEPELEAIMPERGFSAAATTIPRPPRGRPWGPERAWTHEHAPRSW